MNNKQSTQSAEIPAVRTATEARGARIVKGGVMRKILVISVVLGAVAMFVIAFVVAR